jgi:hypothetical protein
MTFSTQAKQVAAAQLASKPTLADYRAGLVSDEDFARRFFSSPVRTRSIKARSK